MVLARSLLGMVAVLNGGVSFIGDSFAVIITALHSLLREYEAGKERIIL